MEDETQNLVQNAPSTDNVVEIAERQPRTITCSRSSVPPILSVFVALLIAGQAVSVYFISQQHSKISALSDATTALKLKDMEKRLPGSPQNQLRQKMRMSSVSIPLAFSDTDGTMQKLEKIARENNKIEDAVKWMLLRTNPLRTYETFNGTIMENLRKMKMTLNDQEWMMFDAWMQQWYLFSLVQISEKDKTASEATGTKDSLTPKKLNKLPARRGTSGHLVYVPTSYSSDSVPNPPEESPSGAPVMTECKERATSPALPGAYVPQCDEYGDYMTMQCWRSTGYCWCVTKNGTEILGTRSRAKIDCEGMKDMPDVDYDPFIEINQP